MANVLHFYGLKTDKQSRLNCPFHEDKTPSFQVYYKTQTAYCFSSNGKTHSKSFIDFIMYKENQSKEDKKVLQKILQNQTFAEPEENSEASAIFYYHADHLGSNEIITDNTGAPHEFHLTLPFGETMAEQRKPVADYYNSWKFTGKELDEETGLYYFGARYYQPSWSVWLSVDPLAEEFPSWSPYHFVHNNPINFVDPDGRMAVRVNGDPPYKIKNSVLSSPNVVNDITSKTHRPKMSGGVTAIVLHRTVSSNASSAINTSKNNKGLTGFHIVVDKDGTVTQLNNFENRANHVWKPTGDVNNYNSIGIEAVGMSVDKDGNPTTDWRKTTGWESLTGEQIESTAQSVNAIMGEYDLGIDDIFPHEDVSRKVDGEGGTVLNAIKARMKNLMLYHHKRLPLIHHLKEAYF